MGVVEPVECSAKVAGLLEPAADEAVGLSSDVGGEGAASEVLLILPLGAAKGTGGY